jgi:PP-loop superfamily ATP-utilizing enzyme
MRGGGFLMRTKPKQLPDGQNYLDLWETEYKPLILSYYEVPIEVVSIALGISVTKVQEQLRSGLYNYGVARPCAGDSYRYEFFPLRLIAFVEGKMS